MNGSFDSVLVANRGEIALRVLRSARAAGYRTIAVYSEADADAPHVTAADEAVLLGPAPARDSYLHAERLLAAAAQTGAGAIHPGYGFLSENAEFAAACADRGIVFIGPSASAIELMGNKAAAKRRMLEAGVPCVPGYQGADQSDAALLAAAQEIGLPLMVKAAAGGGGRGMRLVEDHDGLAGALASARSEALNAFGSDELILEKAVLRPRHVEVQVFGDQQGNVIHLGERDCSVQRRHQKVVEEAPCPVMTPALRDAMGEAAVAAARSIAYVGAGTVEFLLDGDGNFYFLEMNTRLQVEHPVTELVTGLDLVALQLDVARGLPLPLSQEAVQLQGHAIEVRLYAEDTVRDFLPASGTALSWLPPTGPGIRVDDGLLPGQSVSPFYDPMIAKIIAHGADRESARRRLVAALRETVVFGLETNRQFLIDVLEREAFATGEATTAFIAEAFPDGVRLPEPDSDDLVIAGALQARHAMLASQDRQLLRDAALVGATGARGIASTIAYRRDEDLQALRVRVLGQERFAVQLGEQAAQVQVLSGDAAGRFRVRLDGVSQDVVAVSPGPGELCLQRNGRAFQLRNELAFSHVAGDSAGDDTVVAPMHGNVLSVSVAVGDAVARGQEVAVMEAMKMEHRLTAAVDGTVAELYAGEGEQLAIGAPLLRIEVAEAS